MNAEAGFARRALAAPSVRDRRAQFAPHSEIAVVRHAESRPARVPSEVYAAASIELYVRLWLELERLIESAPRRCDVGLEMLRLELLLLLDACDCPHWQSILSTRQRLELRSTVEGVLRALGAASHPGGCGGIAEAQNRLLDAVLTQLHATRWKASAGPWDASELN